MSISETNTPQPGIFSEGVAFHSYLEFRTTSSDPAALKTALAVALAVQPRRDHSLFFAFGKSLLTTLGYAVPDDMMDFPGYASAEHSAPATQADIWLWVQGRTAAGNLVLLSKIRSALASVAEVTLEYSKIPTEQNRDLMGFVDGTGNPKTLAAREAAALDSQGGSYIVAQTWYHDLARFDGEPTHRQEAIIGRTKYEDIELEGDDMPANSHVSRTDVDVDGVAMKSLRRSAVIGDSARQGLYFIGLACAMQRHDVQFRRMYGLTEDGITDAILGYSTPVTGSYFYAPSREQLDSILASA